jgi:NAD+ diphosphatase
MSRKFIPSSDAPPGFSGVGRWFIFSKRKLLVSQENQPPTIPLIRSPQDLGFDALETIYLGTSEGEDCFAAVLPDSSVSPPSMSFQDLFQLYGRLEEDLIPVSFRALHLLDWSQKTRFCKQCGKVMQDLNGQRGKSCRDCGYVSFPRISPAVIVLVEREDTCLLARSPRFREEFYSVLAGFSEPGETLEETVAREVGEETGIEVKDIRYFGSQPWPFPDSLMIGFIARYAGGEIRVDGTEILEAHWFSWDRLPKIPGKISIARSLIDWFINKHQTK